MTNQDVLGNVLSDDRLILGLCNDSLLLAFLTTESWDTCCEISTLARTTDYCLRCQ